MNLAELSLLIGNFTSNLLLANLARTSLQQQCGEPSRHDGNPRSCASGSKGSHNQHRSPRTWDQASYRERTDGRTAPLGHSDYEYCPELGPGPRPEGDALRPLYMFWRSIPPTSPLSPYTSLNDCTLRSTLTGSTAARGNIFRGWWR